MTIAQVWSFLTGWSEAQLKEKEKEWPEWIKCLEWPPDVFALSAAVLRRSGAYTSVLETSRGVKECLADLKAGDLDGAMEWRNWLEQCRKLASAGIKARDYPERLKGFWDLLWECRHMPLYKISNRPDLLAALVDCVALADEVSLSCGLPIRNDLKKRPDYFLVRKGWKRLEPNRFGSSLCSDLIYPHAARVLPKMHTPTSGLTLRSFSHHLALCETDEVQPRWFMIPGARGDVTNQDHMNLLVVPWPEVCLPAQIRKSDKEGVIGRKGGGSAYYFSYEAKSSGATAADRIESLCEEAERLLGSLDGVVLPELALTPDDYHAVRLRVLRKSLMLVTGVGQNGSSSSPGENYLCVDVPLSRHHAIHFRQGKHHRWRLDSSQIRNYGIGGRLNPARSYWEDIEIADRRLLFLVLRPWLVTSVLICEDLARHDPVGELLRSVGPHLVIALLMDGPQLASRWSSRYAAALADDPGSSVLSISSLGMVKLAGSDAKSSRSRTVALWKDARGGGARELEVPDGNAALALTISVEYGREVTADARVDTENSAFPVLTGVHPVSLPKECAGARSGEDRDAPDDDDSARRFLSPHEAAALARLVQQEIDKDPGPTILRELTGEALAIAKEIWRMKTVDPAGVLLAKWLRNPEMYANLPTTKQTETAKQILLWQTTNKRGVGAT
jgi:hypothetical protein